MRVALGTSDTKFSAALNPERRVSVTGDVKAGAPYLTQIGAFDVELAMEGFILLARPAGARPHAVSRTGPSSLYRRCPARAARTQGRIGLARARCWRGRSGRPLYAAACSPTRRRG
jgi:hypothetical protein